jgi:Uma2 family endonuclease
MSTELNYKYTFEEYLDLERNASYKSEYLNGYIYARAGGSERHNLIVANLIIEIGVQLRDKPCRVYASDLKVGIPRANAYFYPDVTVVCGETKFIAGKSEVISNPIVILEVLSESTSNFDRGVKFLAYQKIETLQEYILVTQSEILVEHYVRKDSTSWIYTEFDEREAILKLSSIGCNIKLNDIYAKTI